MFSLSGTRSRAAFACIALTVSVLFMLALASHANAAYLVPNFSLSAAPTQAAGHPKITVSIDPDAANADSTGGDDLKDLTIDAPAGLQLNQAAATTKCTDSTFTGSGNCPSASQVGTATVKWRRSFISTVTFTGKVYVLTTPAAANTAALGLVLKATGFKTQAIRATVSNALPVNGPTRVSLTGITRNIQPSIGSGLGATIDKIDVVLNAKANSNQNGPYFTLNPSSCAVATTQATFTSYANVVVNKSSSYTPSGCPTVKFTPTATVTPTVTSIVAPTGLNTSFTVPTGELTTQQSAVKNITVATPRGVHLNQPALAAVLPCSEANLAADTCPATSKIGTTSFTFWGASAAPGDMYLTAHTASGFNIGAVSRGANGVRAITRGSVAQVDIDADGIPDNLRLSLDSLPTATWSAASLNITSLLMRNNCPTGSVTTTIQSESASTVVSTGTWLIGICDPVSDTTITSGPSGITNQTAPQFTFTGTPASATFECQLDGSSFSSCVSPLTTPTQSQGSHQFCVRAVGPMGPDPSPACRDFTVDSLAPIVNIFSNGPSISFAVTDASPIASVTCRLNSNPAVACTSPWIIPVIEDLSYSFTICATDAAGNTGCSTRVVDVEPPQINISSGPSGYTGSTNATFAFTVSEAGATVSCSLDGSAYAACASPVSYTGLAQGAHTFCVRASDAAGNVGPPACRTWTVDTITPTVSFTSPAPPPNSTSASISWTIIDASPIIAQTCRLDSGAAFACTSPLNLTGLSFGSHSVTVCATDAASNVGCGTLSWSVPPPSFTVSIDSGPPEITTSTSATFTFSASIAGVMFECRLDSAAFAACASPRTYTALAGGTHTFCVRGIDSAGSFSQNTACRSFTLGDPVSPTITSGPSGLTASTSAIFTFSSNTAGASFQCKLDAGAWFVCTSPMSFAGISQGSHTFCINATTAFGISAASCRTWTVDTIPPPAPTVSGPSGTVGANSATITISNAEAGTTTQGSLDGGAFATVTSPVQLTGLADGPHTYAARSIDAAGNVGSATTISWVVGFDPPVVSITSGPSGFVGSTSATFTFVATISAGTTFECRLDAGVWAACVSPTTFTGLSSGSHTFCVRATNGAVTTTEACRTWTVDTTPPPVPLMFLASPTTFPTNQTTAQIVFSSSESGVTFFGSLDGAAFAPVTSPVNLSGLSFGTHVYSLRSRDAAGNVSSTTSITWTISNIVIDWFPTITSGPSGTVTTSTATFAFGGAPPNSTFQCQLDGAAWTSCPNPVTYVALANGTHTFCFRAVDPAGNVYPGQCRTWVIDMSLGNFSVSITSGPSGTVTTPTATFSYVASEVLYLPNPCAPGTPVCVQVIVPKVNLDCKLDSGSYSACPTSSQYGGSYTTPAMSAGPHTFCVRGTRLADGMVSTACRSWTYLPEPPAAPTCSVSGNSVICTFTTPSGGSATCSVDGGAAMSCSNNWIRSGLTPGSHVVRICLIDAGGNSSCTNIPITIASPVVTIASPTSGSTTTDSLATLVYSTSGFDGTPTCDRASGSQVPLTIGINTISVFCSDDNGVFGSATATVTRQAYGGFSPSFSQSFPPGEDPLKAGLVISLNNPANSDPIKSAVIDQPSALEFNYVALGSQSDRCPASSVPTNQSVIFYRENCPAQAKVGSVTMSSPEFSADLHGDVYIVDRQPGAWFGIDFSNPALGNPTVGGTIPSMVIRSDRPQVDPACEFETAPLGYCPTYIEFSIHGFPDASELSTTISIDGPERPGTNGPIPGELFQWLTDNCDTVVSRATIVPVTGASVVRTTPPMLPPC